MSATWGMILIAAMIIALIALLISPRWYPGAREERRQAEEMKKAQVLVWVDGKSHVVTAGPGYAKRLYREIGDLSGQFLCLNGKLLGDYDPVDIKGGEGFGLVRYK